MFTHIKKLGCIPAIRALRTRVRPKSKKNPPCEICRKVFWTSILSLLFIEAVVLVPSFRNEISVLREECIRQGEEAMSFIKLGMQHIAPQELTAELFDHALEIEAVYSIAIFDEQKNLLSRFGGTAPQPAIFSQIANVRGDAEFRDTQSFDNNMLLTHAIERSGDLYYISLALDGSHIDDSVLNYLIRIMAAVAAICLVVGGSLTFIMRSYSSKLQYQAFHDPLTRLPNKAGMQRYLQKAIDDQKPFDLLALDLDSFHVIEERWGPENANYYLTQIAQLIDGLLPDGVWHANIQRDLFGIYLPTDGLSKDAHCDNIQTLTNSLLLALTKPITIENTAVSTTACFGIYTSKAGRQTTAEGALKALELSIHEAKSKGSNNIAYYSDAMAAKRVQKISVISRLRVALAEERLSLVYQPQYCAKTGRLGGAESLMRWDDPEIGNVSPAVFIPLAESTGIIIDYGKWALESAVVEFLKWQQAGLEVPCISVNLSPAQFTDKNLVKAVTELVTTNNLSSGQLELEVTESAIIETPDTAQKTMRALAEIGVKFAIDDFGTGHSSLANLGSFPFNRLKIDQSFVRRLTDSKTDRTIVRSCIELAHDLGMDVVAEGVEHQQELDLLSSWNCDIIQGYLLNKPLTVDQFHTHAIIDRLDRSKAA